LEQSDVGPGAIGPAQLDLGLHSFIATEGTTTSSTPAGLGASIGPIVTIDVPQDALVAVYATAQIKRTGGFGCSVHIAEPELPPGGVAQLFTSDSNSYVAMFTAPGTSALGTPMFTDGGWLMFPASPGPHTYTMKYSAITGSSCDFKNRELAIGAVA
jgi:hypothetical protein